MYIPPHQEFFGNKVCIKKQSTLTERQLRFGVNTAIHSNGETIDNLSTAHNTAQTTIKQQAQSIAHIMAQMYSLQRKLEMQQQLDTAQTNARPTMTMSNQRLQPCQAPQQQPAYGSGGQG